MKQAMINQEVKDQVKNHHIVNIALFGSDNARKAQWNDYEMERADATKIISLDFDAKKIKITSLQRDTLIWIPEPYNDYDKLNQPIGSGGSETGSQDVELQF